MRLSYFVLFFVSSLVLFSCEGNYEGSSSYEFNSGVAGEVVAGDNYNALKENDFIDVNEEPISTFSIDADGASYSNVRRFIQQDNILPPLGATRTEELINYFDLDYEFDNPEHPISINGEVSACPWTPNHKLIRIGLKGREIPKDELPASNFVFLIDVSGSMNSSDKLELLKKGFVEFIDELTPNDRVAIVTYAGSAGVVLESTSADQKSKIKDAINSLGAGGSTAGADGIITAYEIAEQHLIEGGNNRIIIGTDGDFNIGPVSQDDLVDLIETKRDLGVFITVIGVGRGNLNDASLEQIADNGNGTYEYIDDIDQMRKVFIYDFSKFFTVAKDVKIQVSFNPDIVTSYRLIGYENRILEEEDFEDDEKDAGEIGANQNITALYEIIPEDNPDFKSVPTFDIDFRYKNPDDDVSNLLELEVYDFGLSFQESSDFMQFTSAVASFGMLLIDSNYKGNASYEKVIDWLKKTNLQDKHGLKNDLLDVVEDCKNL